MLHESLTNLIVQQNVIDQLLVIKLCLRDH